MVARPHHVVAHQRLDSAHMLVASDLQTFLHTLPAGTQVAVAFMTIGRADGMTIPVRLDHAAPAIITPSTSAATPHLIIMPASATASDTRVRGKGYRAAQQYLEKHKESLQAATHTVTEWAKRVGLSERELRRAIYENALEADQKKTGKDHGAYLVLGSDLRRFVDTVVAVEQKLEPAPAWWASVRLRSA